MTVGDLIKKLKEYDPSYQVRLITDHGQCPMVPNDVSVIYITDMKDWMADEISEDDLDDYDDDYDTVVGISAF